MYCCRSVANAIRAGIFVERIYRRLNSATFLQLPPEVTRVLRVSDHKIREIIQ